VPAYVDVSFVILDSNVVISLNLVQLLSSKLRTSKYEQLQFQRNVYDEVFDPFVINTSTCTCNNVTVIEGDDMKWISLNKLLYLFVSESPHVHNLGAFFDTYLSLIAPVDLLFKLFECFRAPSKYIPKENDRTTIRLRTMNILKSYLEKVRFFYYMLHLVL
jgi:hypothetical protein